MVNKLNIEFQAETFRLHKLRSSINTNCRTILGFFIKREKIKDKNVSDIDVADPSNYLPIEKIYLFIYLFFFFLLINSKFLIILQI